VKLSSKEEYLGEVDNKLKKIIEKNGHIVFKPNRKNQFESLVKIIISQFISTKAANTIFLNLKKSLNTDSLQPLVFRDLSTYEIKKLGLSVNKLRSIKSLSDLFIDQNFTDLKQLSEEDLHKNLLSVFGVGDWSVCMFEIFCIGKLNIFSSKDAALRTSMNRFGMIKPESDLKFYDDYAERWSPYKTIASLHLWKAID
tara:strand:- start:4156 stop:4749 length:594 start_codon:yes stop_codon:yes gene_type:complete